MLKSIQSQDRAVGRNRFICRFEDKLPSMGRPARGRNGAIKRLRSTSPKVEVAWNPEWVGSEQIRFFKLDGDRLKVLSPWRVMPNWPDKGMTRSILSFDRSK